MSDAAHDFGRTIREFRLARGLSRRQVALAMAVDITAIRAWEAGTYRPREDRLAALAAALGTTRGAFAAAGGAPEELCRVVSLDTMAELPPLLLRLLTGARHSLKALRVAAPYPTAAHVQTGFRTLLGERLLAGTIEVQRVEIFYSLDRLKEMVSNLLRYEGCAYHVKSYCAGLKEVVPGMGGYAIDDADFLIGAYWAALPPHKKNGLHITGEPFRQYFLDYWAEIWSRGTVLTARSVRDLSPVREIALALGLRAGQWKGFMEEARAYEVGDGAPPLV